MTRIGFKVTAGMEPVKGAIITGDLIVPAIETDENGEAFSIVPIFIKPSLYLVNINISFNNKVMNINEIAEEISSYYKIDISTKTWTVERLSARIGGDGFYAVNQGILRPEQLIVSNTDTMLSISNCEICVYYDRLFSRCIVNGKLTSPIPIAQPFITTSPFYYPFFLLPSAQRIDRDSKRFL